MKVQEVILKAMAGSLKWWEAAEIIGVSDRTMRRWRERYQEGGYDGLYDRRRRRPSPKRVPLQTAERVLQLYREKYFDFNVRHFHEKLTEEHGMGISYSWVKMALQGAGLVKRVFSIQHERTVNGDNTIALDNRVLQIEKTRWRNTLAGCKVTVRASQRDAGGALWAARGGALCARPATGT